MLGTVELTTMPRVYNLLSDPKELYNIYQYGGRHGEDSMWVTAAVMKLVVEHNKTLVEEPPIKTGTPDPYRPPGKRVKLLIAFVDTARLAANNCRFTGIFNAVGPRHRTTS